MIKNQSVLGRWTAIVALMAAVGLLAALAVPVIYAQEKAAPSAPAAAERAKETAQKAEAKEAPEAKAEVEGERVMKAVAVLHPASDSKVRGVVTLTQEEGGVHVVAHVEGLTPGQHGFHVHEYGDCTAPDAGSAGGHFNPTNKPHAGPDDAERHDGDLGNIEADAQGVGHYDRVDKVLQLNGKRSVLGRAVIVHGNPDDLKSQPAGNAGPRVACGVIGIAKQ